MDYSLTANERADRKDEGNSQTASVVLPSPEPDSTIFIHGIQYGQYERLVDYTDSTDTIKSAHFRKDGSIRITDDQRMLTLEDAGNTKIKWRKVR